MRTRKKLHPEQLPWMRGMTKLDQLTLGHVAKQYEAVEAAKGDYDAANLRQRFAAGVVAKVLRTYVRRSIAMNAAGLAHHIDDGTTTTSCCERTVFELPRTDRLVLRRVEVTCTGAR